MTYDPELAEATALYLAREFAADPAGWYDLTAQLQDTVVQSAAFSDTLDSPYHESISALAAFGLVNGKEDGLFHPQDTLSRAELAQMLLNALNSWIPANADTFSDVPADAWYADAVNAIAAQGFMEGTGEGRFSPGEVLTHQELITVLGRLSRWLNDDLDLVSRRSDPTDWQLKVLADYADWAKPSVWLLSCGLDDGVNLLWDYPESIDPTAPATRGEAADLLCSILYYLNILSLP